MVELKRIRKYEDTAECEVYPEDSKKPGKLLINILSGEIISYSLPKGYEYCTNHIHHAARGLLLEVQSDAPRESRLIMWY